MATKTFEELKQLAIQIRDEKTNKQNTATRVGTAMLEHINKLEQDYYDKTKTDEELKERDDKLTELEWNTTNIINNESITYTGKGIAYDVHILREFNVEEEISIKVKTGSFNKETMYIQIRKFDIDGGKIGDRNFLANSEQ